ncbi:MAG: universal stress protein [Tannerella sp.]|jgi:nucleotide-binding universal stress UspA family protein|nr:universal stress protein [Tannerella sp.]
MEDKLVTLAIHTYEKAQILKTILESEGMEVFIHNVNQIQPVVSAGVRVRIKESDLPHALRIIEATQFFKEDEEPSADDNVKKILIPVDFSDYSMRACEIGFEYASRIGAEVMLLHAYYIALMPSSLLYLGLGQDAFDDESVRIAYDRMQADLKNMVSVIDHKVASGELPEVKYNYIIREGLPDDEIIAYAKEYRPTFIIMGTRGKNRKNLDLIGSITAEIIERTKVPLLAAPEDITFENLKEVKNIAFATSFNEHDLVAFDRFTKLMNSYAPNVHLFNISTSKDEWDEIRLTGTREYLKKHYPDINIDFTVLDSGELLDAVDKFVREKQIDVIALTTYRRSMITKIFNPSIARRMLFHSNTALLVIPEYGK